MNVGLSTTIVRWGNRFFPSLGDLYLGKTGYKAQQTKEAADPDRHDNLWQPVPGDHGAHGDFGHRAQSNSIQLWATTKGRLVALAGPVGAVIAGVLLGRRG